MKKNEKEVSVVEKLNEGFDKEFAEKMDRQYREQRALEHRLKELDCIIRKNAFKKKMYYKIYEYLMDVVQEMYLLHFIDFYTKEDLEMDIHEQAMDGALFSYCPSQIYKYLEDKELIPVEQLVEYLKDEYAFNLDGDYEAEEEIKGISDEDLDDAIDRWKMGE